MGSEATSKVEQAPGGWLAQSRLAERLEAYDRSDLGEKRPRPVLSVSLSRPGVAVGLLFVALSVLPSMLPKSILIEGVVLGVTFVVGYGLGGALQWLWRFLELPVPGGKVVWAITRAWWLVLLGLLCFNSWRHVGWQNSVRDTFGMDAISPWVWVPVLPIAVAVAGLLLVAARSLRMLFHVMVRWFDRHLSRRLALLVGGAAFTLIIWGVWSEVLVDGFFALANQISAPVDASTDEGITQPSSVNRSGSPASLVEWESLGRQGRKFVSTGPTVDELNALHGQGAMEPIRVYVGLKSAPTVEQRAELALNELIRTRAFDRDVLVVATTTGTGKLDPNSIDALDYVTNGNVAVAGVQYSYLPSAISLLADVDEVKETARAVFDVIHGFWANIPVDERPEFYVYGLSLGSYGVESILTSIEIINAPIDGAVMVGPPFFSPLWNELIAGRDPASSAISPVYRQGQTVRFATESSIIDAAEGEWGDTRILYLQHASDPVVYFSPALLLEEPSWLGDGHRPPEISDSFAWVPFVTLWQVLTDMAGANTVPDGFGHRYTIEAHARAWLAVIGPPDRSASDVETLLDHLAQVGSAEAT